jgi:ParB-like nuclease domain
MIIETTKPDLMPHPFAAKFPALSEKDFAGLKSDIQQNGLLSPIVVNSKGEVLDGMHRLAACRELGLEPRTVQLSELLSDKPVNKMDFIFSANFHRRHLTDDQRIALYAEFLPQLRKQAQANLEGTLIHGRLKGGAPIRHRRAGNDPPPKKGGVRTKLADLAGVGPNKAQRAIKLADNDPELLSQVSRGEKSLATAFHEATGGQPAPSAEPPPPKPIELRKLEGKIDKWLVRFLSRFDRAQRGQVLQVISDMVSARLEKIS